MRAKANHTRRKKAQMFAEYIVAFFLFSLMIVFIFTDFFSKNQGEAQKIAEQSSNIIAQSLARLTFETAGQNTSGDAAWETKCNATLIDKLGLAQPNNPYLIRGRKLDCFRALNPQDISEKFYGLPGSDIRIPLRVNAIPKINGPAGCATAYSLTPGSFSGICNRLGTGIVYFSIGNTSNPAELKMELFFPLANAAVYNDTIDSGDKIENISVSDGTKILVDLFVNKSDRDKFNITTAAAPDAVYVRLFSYKFLAGGDVGNFTISNSTDVMDLPISVGGTAEASSQEIFFAPQDRFGGVMRAVVVNASDGTLYIGIAKTQTVRRQEVER